MSKIQETVFSSRPLRLCGEGTQIDTVLSFSCNRVVTKTVLGSSNKKAGRVFDRPLDVFEQASKEGEMSARF